MVQYLWLIPLGFGIGVYGTLIGVGGGIILVPVLLLLYPEESPEIITSISLAVVFFNALSGSAAYARMKRIDYRSGLLFAAATIPGAILGALTTGYIPRRVFDVIFGLFLVVAAIFLLLRPIGEKAREHLPRHYITRHLVEANGTKYTFSYNPIIGVVLSFFIGYVSSLLGLGGGIFHVPALIRLLNFPVHIATATSHFMLTIMSLTGTIVHVVTGVFSHGFRQTLSLAIGVLLGAQLGAQLSQRVQGVWIMRSLAIALGFAGIRIFIVALSG